MKIKSTVPLFLAVLLLTAASLSACSNAGDGDTTQYEAAENTEAGTEPSTGAQSTNAQDTAPDETDSPWTKPVTELVTEPVTKPDTEPSEDVMTTPEKTLRYVALGDSIAYGYGLAKPETERYSALIDAYLDSIPGTECDGLNYGVNGQTSSELLTALMTDASFAPDLANADIVTVSIGANNVLGPAISMFAQYALNMMIEDASLRDASNKRLYESFNAEADEGVARFAADLPRIIDAIKSKAPNAKIILQTVYNPYNRVSLALPLGDMTLELNQSSDALVKKLNEIIIANAGTLGYEVADVYTALEGETGVVNAEGFSGGELFDFTALDPHPTAKGHTVIAETYKAKLGV